MGVCVMEAIIILADQLKALLVVYRPQVAVDLVRP